MNWHYVAMWWITGLTVLDLTARIVEVCQGPMERKPRSHVQLGLELVLSFINAPILLWLIWGIK